MNRSKKNFLALLEPKNSPLGAQNVKNSPKIQSKSKVIIEWSLQNLSCSAIGAPKLGQN